MASADASGALARSDAAKRAALGVVAENVLADCTPYVPYETGALQGSGEGRVEGGAGVVEWGTTADTARYARVQYYGVGLSHATDANAAMAPMATHHWFEKARAARGEAWADMFGAEYGRRL